MTKGSSGAQDDRAIVQSTFGSNLRWCRTQRLLTQAELASAAGLHWTYVGQIERGERNLTLQNVVRLCRALQVPVGDLFDGIDGISQPSTE